MSENTKNEATTWTENLPKPPVPSVEETIARYLAGLQPVIPWQQFEQTKQTADGFLRSGEGERLQKLLKEYAERSDNWVTDFWLEDMYLCNPVPLLVNSNPFFLLPRQTFKDTAEQVHFAAELVRFALIFRDQINNQILSQEVGKGQKRDQKLCMQTYRHFFTACRIPGEFKDDLQILRKSSDHFIVAAFNQFYAVHLDASEKNLPTVEDLAICLHSIWTAAKGAKEKAPPVGILTTDNRKTWALARKQLLKLDAKNKSSLEYMEECLFVLCLDDFVTPRVPTKSGYRNSIQLARMDMSYMASMLLHAGGSTLHTANRWFDKFLQIVVSKEGICGLVIEHSASEGVTVLRFLELFLAHQSAMTPAKGLCRQSSVEMRQRESTLRRTALQWKVNAEVETMIKQSEKNADKVIQDLDMYVLKFVEFGHEFIKSQHISPDVFIQLALQLTYYKLHRRVVSTYESCSLRQFRKGRVDNIRSATKEALAWARSMCGDCEETKNENEKTQLFKRAICKQTEVLKYTASGYGPDNHLVGLRELAKSSSGQIPALFREKSYKEFINFRLSTSQLFTGADILIGYGPVVSDGYGCCYMPKSGCMYFVISSFFSSAETSSDFFASSLEGSLLQMRELCQKMNDTENNEK